MTVARPKILRLGPWKFSEKKWSELASFTEVIDCQSTDREEFIRDLQGKYSDVASIVRTFCSVLVTGRIDADLVQHFPKSLLSVCHNGAGYDQIDVQALSDRNIQLSNVTTPVEAPTALTAVYLIFAAMRNFQWGHDLLVQGKWLPGTKCADAPIGYDPEGKTIGILGMGGIGRAIRDRLQPFGFGKTIYYNRKRLSSELEGSAEYVSFDDLIANSDIIMVSVPLNPKTHHLLNSETISKMKDGVIVINTARGAIIDENALTDSLKEGKVGAFGSDVFEFEPKVSPELSSLPNVVSLPHMGTFTVQAMENMENFVVENVETLLKTGKVMTVVAEQSGRDFEHPVLLA